MYSNIPINNINYSLQTNDTTPAAIRQFLNCFEQTLRIENIEFKKVLLDEFYKLLYIINENNKEQTHIKQIFDKFENLLKYENTLTQQLLSEDNLIKFKQEVLKSNIFTLIKQYLNSSNSQQKKQKAVVSKQIVQSVKNVKIINAINSKLFKSLTVTTNSNIKKSNEYTTKLDEVSENLDKYKSTTKKGIFSSILKSAFRLPGIIFSAASSLGFALLKGTKFALKYTVKAISLPIKLAINSLLFGASFVGKLIKFLLSPTGLKITAFFTGFMSSYFKDFNLKIFIENKIKSIITNIKNDAINFKNTVKNKIDIFYNNTLQPSMFNIIGYIQLVQAFFENNKLNVNFEDCKALKEDFQKNLTLANIEQNANNITNSLANVKDAISDTVNIVNWMKYAFDTMQSKEFLYIITSSLIGGAIGMAVPKGAFSLLALAGTSIVNSYIVANKIHELAYNEQLNVAKSSHTANKQNANATAVANATTMGSTRAEQPNYNLVYGSVDAFDINPGNRLILNDEMLYKNAEWEIIKYDNNSLQIDNERYIVNDNFISSSKKCKYKIVNKPNETEIIAVNFYRKYNGVYTKQLIEYYINTYIIQRQNAIAENSAKATKLYPDYFPIIITKYTISEKAKIDATTSFIQSHEQATIGYVPSAKRINDSVVTKVTSKAETNDLGFSEESNYEVVSLGVTRIPVDDTKTDSTYKVSIKKEHEIETKLIEVFSAAFLVLYRTYYYKKEPGTNYWTQTSDVSVVNVYTKLSYILEVYSDIILAMLSNILNDKNKTNIVDILNNIKNQNIISLKNAEAQPEFNDNIIDPKARLNKKTISNIENVKFIRSFAKVYTSLLIYFQENFNINIIDAVEYSNSKTITTINNARLKLSSNHDEKFKEKQYQTGSNIGLSDDNLTVSKYDGVIYRVKKREGTRYALEIAPSTLIPYIFYNRYQYSTITLKDCITHYNENNINNVIEIITNIILSILNEIDKTKCSRIYNIYFNDFLVGNNGDGNGLYAKDNFKLILNLENSGLNILYNNKLPDTVKSSLKHFISSPYYAYAAGLLVFNTVPCLRDSYKAVLISLIGKLKTTAIYNKTYLNEMSLYFSNKLRTIYKNTELEKFALPIGSNGSNVNVEAEAVAKFFEYLLMSGYDQLFDRAYIQSFKNILIDYTNEFASFKANQVGYNEILTPQMLKNTFRTDDFSNNLTNLLADQSNSNKFHVSQVDRRISFTDYMRATNISDEDKLQLSKFYNIKLNSADSYQQLSKLIKLEHISLKSLVDHANLLMPYLYIYNILAGLKTFNNLSSAKDMLYKTGLLNKLANLFGSAYLPNTMSGKNINIPIEVFTNTNLQTNLQKLLHVLTYDKTTGNYSRLPFYEESTNINRDELNLQLANEESANNIYNNLVTDTINCMNNIFSNISNKKTIIEKYTLETANGHKTNIIDAKLSSTWGSVISEIFSKLPNTIDDQVLLDMFLTDHSEKFIQRKFSNLFDAFDTISSTYTVNAPTKEKLKNIFKRENLTAKIINKLTEYDLNNNILLCEQLDAAAITEDKDGDKFSTNKTSENSIIARVTESLSMNIFYSIYEANVYLYTTNKTKIPFQVFNRTTREYICTLYLTKSTDTKNITAKNESINETTVMPDKN